MIRFYALLFIPLLFINCGEDQPQPLTETQLKIFTYLPPDTQFLLYTNLGELRKTDHWKNFFGSEFESNDSESWLSEFEKKTGAGLNKGISEVYTSTGWSGNNVVAVVFNDADGVINYFEGGEKFSAEDKDGNIVYSLKDDPASKFYFPEKNILLIVKDRAYLSALISKENKSLKENKKFIEIIENIRSKNHYWFATDKGSYASLLIQKLIGTKNNAQTKKIVSVINSISLSAEFSDGVKIESVIGCKDEKNAHLLSTGIRSALAMNLLSTINPLFDEILQKIDIDRVENKLNLQIEINNENILKLKNITQKRPTDKKL